MRPTVAEPSVDPSAAGGRLWTTHGMKAEIVALYATKATFIAALSTGARARTADVGGGP